MGKNGTYALKTEEFLNSISPEMDFEVVDVEFVKEAGNYYLRAYCDKDGGIGVEDCAAISRRLSEWLDREDFIDESYILEVSSPGLGRKLKKDRDFERATGQKIDIKTYVPKGGKKQFAGILKEFDEKTVTIDTDGEELVFLRKEIADISLTVEL